MIATREETQVSVPEAQMAEKLDWVRPEIRRMSAGSAEQGGATTTDLGVNFS
ncbi:MAG: hypothetical protein ACXW2T_01550 [Allosphingosinicella sp.]